MKSSRSLLAVAVVVLGMATIGSFAWLQTRLDSASTDQTSPGTAVEIGDPRTSADIAQLSVDSSALEGGQRASAEVPLGRTVEVRLTLPAGAVPDPELEVVALAAAGLAGDGLRERLEDERTKVTSVGRAHFEGRVANLVVPEGIDDPVLVLDGRFLYLEAPRPIADDETVVTLEPKLGACLVVRTEAGAGVNREVVAGSLQVMGGDFSGGRGGFERRSLVVGSGDSLEFRALDPRFVWSLVPTLDEHHANGKLGLEFEPGEERVLALALLSGARISGTVVDDANNPLAGVSVRLSGENPWFGGADGKRGETDEQGAFELVGVAPGSRELVASLDGWREARSAELELADGERVEGVRLTMDRGAALAGTVSWPDGRPAEEAEILVEALQSRGWGGWGGDALRPVGRARSGAGGKFRVTGLEEGPYIVRAERRGRETTDDEGPLWRARQEGVAADTQDLALELAGPIAFAGTVVDDRGEPIAAFAVEARSTAEGGARERQSFEAEDGRFLFERAGPGEWRIRVSADGHVPAPEPTVVLSAGTEVPELEFQLERTATIRGVVSDPFGAPVAGAEVAVEGDTGNPWVRTAGPRTETDADGAFVLEGLEPGAIALVASAEDWADSESTPFRLAPGDSFDEARLLLRIGGRIIGAVTTPEGDPMVGRRVSWGANAMGFGSRGEMRADSAGQFEFERVTPGEWAVTAAPSMAEMGERMSGGADQTAFIDIMGELVTETVTVVDGETTEVYLGGEPRQPVRVFGVVSRAGEPLAGAQVFAVSEGSAVFEGMKTAISGSDGSYELTVDRPGSYVLSANVEQVGVEVIVDIPREDEARVDLGIPLGRIEGVVEKPDGDPAAGVRLSLERRDGLGRVRWNGSQVTADEEGRYAFEDLEAGIYAVRANTGGWGGRQESGWGTGIEEDIVVEPDAATLGVDFKLEAAGIVRGSVTGPAGGPVSAATVFFRDSAGRLVSSVSGTTTDSAGEFEAEGLAPGDYTLSVRASGFAANDAGSVRVASGETSTVELIVEDGVIVLVVLEDKNGAARRARIEVFDRDGREVGGLITLEAVRSLFNEGASSLEREVGPLPPGRYTVRATTVDGKVSERSVRLRSGSEPKTVKLELDD